MAYLGINPSQRVFSQNSYKAVSGDTATTTGLVPLIPYPESVLVMNGSILYPNSDYSIDPSTRQVLLVTPCMPGAEFLLMNLGTFNFANISKTGGADGVFIENGQTVTSDYTITPGKNAGSFGPIGVNTGVTVTIPNNSVWTIV